MLAVLSVGTLALHVGCSNDIKASMVWAHMHLQPHSAIIAAQLDSHKAPPPSSAG